MNMCKKTLLLLLAVMSAAAGCDSEDKRIESALGTITADEMKEHISVLASDDFQGRFPATEGEEKTIRYLAEQFRQTGLKPANGES
jgi:hypothetical protein